jgi:hypothetical protein
MDSTFCSIACCIGTLLQQDDGEKKFELNRRNKCYRCHEHWEPIIITRTMKQTLEYMVPSWRAREILNEEPAHTSSFWTRGHKWKHFFFCSRIYHIVALIWSNVYPFFRPQSSSHNMYLSVCQHNRIYLHTNWLWSPPSHQSSGYRGLFRRR